MFFPEIHQRFIHTYELGLSTKMVVPKTSSIAYKLVHRTLQATSSQNFYLNEGCPRTCVDCMKDSISAFEMRKQKKN
jgi:hypothetical protein